MPYSLYEIRPLCFVVQAWNEEGQFYHGLANLKNKDVWEARFKELGIKTPIYFLHVDASELAHKLPGIFMRVTNPVSGNEQDLYSVIINLNDTHKWSREKIADWIETLDTVPKFEV